MGSHGALNERAYIHLCSLFCVSLPYPFALPSPLSSGSVIDRLQQLRPPTALSSFGDTLSVLIRALIGSLAVGEWHQGLGQRGDTDFPEIVICAFPPLPSCPSLSTALYFFQRFFSHLILTLIYSWFHKYLVINQYVYSSTLCFYFIPLYYLLSHRNTLLHTDKRVC